MGMEKKEENPYGQYIDYVVKTKTADIAIFVAIIGPGVGPLLGDGRLQNNRREVERPY